MSEFGSFPMDGRPDADAERLAAGFAEHVVRWARRLGESVIPRSIEDPSGTVIPDSTRDPSGVVIPDLIRDPSGVVIPDLIRDPSSPSTLSPALTEGDLAILRRCAYEVSLATSNGHVCIMLSDLAVTPSPSGAGQGWGHSPEQLRHSLLSTPVVGTPESPGACPLVLDEDSRLYLHRYFDYEVRLARRLMQAASAPPRTIDVATRDRLNTLFQSSNTDEVDWQKIAAAMALRNGLTVISGGPGTGKTTTVVNLIACLLTQDPHSRIALAAPTGKAAARMTEAIRQRAGHLPESLREKLPTESFTIHRLLGANPGLGKFTHDAGNPLPYDVLIVDEASMLDLALATRLLEAVPVSARIVLLGDKDQLSAVESGAVFAELCADPTLSDACRRDVAELCGYAPERIAPPAPAQVSALRDAAVWLTKNYRFAADSGIGKLAKYINEGRAEEAIAWLRGLPTKPFALSLSKGNEQENAAHAPLPVSRSKGKKGAKEDTASLPLFPELAEQKDSPPAPASTPSTLSLSKGREPDPSVQWLEPGPGKPDPLDAVLAGYAPYVEAVRRDATNVDAITRAFAQFRALCAVREGPSGVNSINEQLARHTRQALSAATGRQPTDSRSTWYLGRPIMVLRNDYIQKLFNGDIGIALPSPGGELAVFFPDGETGYRCVPVVRMPDHDTAFATTVHKAQGSEFESVLVLLPMRGTRVATRELLYTAVTRARRSVSVFTNREVLGEAMVSQTRRFAGLFERLAQATLSGK